jgi:putative transposase
MPEHIHMLVSIPPKLSVSQFMGYLKGKSAFMIFDQHANLKYKFMISSPPDRRFQRTGVFMTGSRISIFMHSSEMISHHLGINDYALHQYRVDTMEVAINCNHLYIEHENKNSICAEFENIAKSIGLNLYFGVENNIVFVKEKVNAQTKNALYQAIGLSNFWKSVVCQNVCCKIKFVLPQLLVTSVKFYSDD